MDEDATLDAICYRTTKAMLTPQKWPPLTRRVGGLNVMDLVGVGSHPGIPAHHMTLVVAFLFCIRERATGIRFEPWRFTQEESPGEGDGPGFRMILELDDQTHEMVHPPRYVRTPMARAIEALAGFDRPRRRVAGFLRRCADRIDGQPPSPRSGSFRLNLGGDPIDVDVTAYPSDLGERYFLKLASRSDNLWQAATRELRRLYGQADSPLCPDLR